MRITLAFALLGVVIAAGVTLGQERDYRGRAFVIRVPPAAGQSALALARSDPILRRALALYEVDRPGGVAGCASTRTPRSPGGSTWR